jgi:aspartate dehydrogenase
MKIALIGNGAMSGYVLDKQSDADFEVSAIILRPERVEGFAGTPRPISNVADLPDDVSLVVDCAGHEALRSCGADVLRSGRSLITVSIGALADDALMEALKNAAQAGGSCLHLASGALGSLDCLNAAKAGALQSVTYIGRKPPKGWMGSPAEDTLDLAAMTTEAATHFKGTAREAALAYPKNANVAAAVALAGAGLDNTTVELIADPSVSANIHEVHAQGDFGNFTFQIAGETLPNNTRTSALAAMSVVAKITELGGVVRF